MKNLLLVSNFYSQFISSGTSQRTRDIKKGMQGLGWNCKVVTIKRGELPIEKEEDMSEIISLKIIFERYPIPIFSIEKLFYSILQSNIVHIIDHWSLLNIYSVVFCLLTNTPYVFSPCGALKPTGKNIFIKKIYNVLFLKFILKFASSIYVVTKNEYKEIMSMKINKHVEIYPNGVWKNKVKIRKINGWVNEKKIPNKYLLFLGRLSFIKGPDILLKAFIKSNINEIYSLVFAGPDDCMMDNMLAYYKKSKSKARIIFLGQVNPEEKDFLFRNAELTIIPSRREAMSLVAIESAFKETPFLATDCCGLDSFYEEEAGFLCKANDHSISENLNVILKNKKVLREVGIKARKHVHSNYLWPKIISKMNYSLSILKR